MELGFELRSAWLRDLQIAATSIPLGGPYGTSVQAQCRCHGKLRLGEGMIPVFLDSQGKTYMGAGLSVTSHVGAFG